MSESYLNAVFALFSEVLTDTIVEIVVNPDGSVWCENRGDAYMKQSDLRLTKEQVHDCTENIASEGGIRISQENPLGTVSVNYDDWLVRIQLVLDPVVRGCNAMAMRFFKPNVEVFEPSYLDGKPQSASALRHELKARVAELAEGNLLDALRLCVEEKLNLVVSGGTGTGKTTVARWLVQQVADTERIITIEDTPDLMPYQPNKVMMISNRKSDVRSPDMLLQASLRMRPDRILLSEVTGADSYTFLKAINTGHGGSITTIHAETAELAVERMAQTALEADGKMTYQDMISYVNRSIDVIIHVARQGAKRGVMQVFLPEDVALNEEK